VICCKQFVNCEQFVNGEQFDKQFVKDDITFVEHDLFKYYLELIEILYHMVNKHC